MYTALLGIPADQLSNPPPAEQADDSIKGLTSSLSTQLSLQGGASRERAFNQPVKQAEWTEPEELVSLRAEGNRIKEIDIEIGSFGGLKVIDVSWKPLV